jgi:hypothetical protein
MAEDKIKELDQSVKDYEKLLRKHERNMQDLWDTMKRPKLQFIGTEKNRLNTN